MVISSTSPMWTVSIGWLLVFSESMSMAIAALIRPARSAAKAASSMTSLYQMKLFASHC